MPYLRMDSVTIIAFEHGKPVYVRWNVSDTIMLTTSQELVDRVTEHLKNCGFGDIQLSKPEYDSGEPYADLVSKVIN